MNAQLASPWGRLTIVTFVVALFGGCQESSLVSVDAGDAPDWLVAEPADVGMDSAMLEKVFDYAFDPVMNTQGVVIIKDGYLVAERYAPDAGPESWATSWSVGKSFASAAIGMAWDDGLIESLDQPMSTWYPEWAVTGFADITLRDVLTMSSGLKWNETYGLGDDDDASNVADMVLRTDPLSTVLERPQAHVPGEHFYYSSGDTMLLSKVVEALTGKNPTVLLQERLFVPLGMTQIDWWQDSLGNTYTFCCVDTTTRNFAKFGQLYLQRGIWGGKQILSEQWVQMTTAETANDYPAGYGLQWWLNERGSLLYPSLPHNAYFALGHDQQHVAVFPDQQLVVARNGTYIKPEGEAIAESGLFQAGLWSDDLGPTGSKPPDGDWSNDAFLALVLEAIVDVTPTSGE